MFKLYLGDCLDILPGLDKVGAIITDVPYGTTACTWDEVIPFPLMWQHVDNLLASGIFLTTTSEPFTSRLVASNLPWYKYSWIWEKDQVSNPQLAKQMPLKNYEEIPVFCRGTAPYYPQGVTRTTVYKKKDTAGKNLGHVKAKAYTQECTNYPKAIISFPTERGLHPTQKPVGLYKYLILTYTNLDDTVLDFCMGSGTTGVACMLTGRHFIGIEKEEKYFHIAEQRIEMASMQLPLVPYAKQERLI